MKKTIFVFVFLFFFSFNSYTQSVKPFNINMGGGAFSSPQNNYSWSIGEPIAGYTFNSTNNLTIGLMQSNIDIVTSILDNGQFVFGNQITIAPNPSFGDIQVRFSMNESGKVKMLIFNSISTLLQNQDLGFVQSNQTKKISISNLNSGTYFMKIVFESNNQTIKQGLYKIIKL